MKKKRLNDATRACEGLRQKAQVTGKSRLNNRLERREGKGTLNAGRTLWLAENKGLSKLTQIKFTLRAKCITKIRYLAARPLNIVEIKGEINEESLFSAKNLLVSAGFMIIKSIRLAREGDPNYV